VHEAAVPSAYGYKDHWPYILNVAFFLADSTILQRFGLPSSLLLFAALGWVAATNAFCTPLKVANLDFPFSLGRLLPQKKLSPSRLFPLPQKLVIQFWKTHAWIIPV